MIPASVPNETSSSAKVASKRFSTGEKGGSLSSEARIRSRGQTMISTGAPMQCLSVNIQRTIACTTIREAMDSSSPAISVRDLRKVYGNKAAVDGLSLTVPRGCFFGFLGPNGAGKTTTIKMLMGLAPPTSGTISLLGLPMPESALAVKGRIGLVPDETLLFDHLTGA